MEACTASAPREPETTKATKPESDIQEVAGEAEYPARADNEFGTNCSPWPNIVIELLPLEDAPTGITAVTVAASNALALTKDPWMLWTDSFTFKEMPLAYGALDLILESEIHAV